MSHLRLAIACGLASLASGCLLLAEPPVFTTGSDGSDGGGGNNAAPETGWTELTVGFGTAYAIDADGAIWLGDTDGLQLLDEGPFISVSANGWGDACAVQFDGLLRCGLRSSSSNPFEVTGDFVAVSGSSDSGCGLESDGSARCWPGALEIPGPFESIGAGDTFACGIREGSGALECWAIENVIFDEALTDVPLGSFTRVVTSDHMGCALSTAGSISCWGYDFDDLLAGPSGGVYVDLSMQDGAACAVLESGSIQCWGSSASFPPTDVSYSRVAVGYSLNCGIGVDTTFHCWSTGN